ncbi:STAS domain-containing protein [Pseudonocardia sp. GCM10023141]|uniref:STAS domain-containing protein n=1 Tax=Pseudonocardia sp. GCM10023141 TaxID=3252653 RepID=UPI0036D2A82D
MGITTGRIDRAGRAALVVTVTGDIDLSTVQRFRTAVAEGLDRVDDETPDGAPLIIDLTEVTFLGSAGLHALVEVTRAAQRRREPLRIVVDHARPVIRPIEMTGLDDLLALHHTLDDALDSSPEPAT